MRKRRPLGFATVVFLLAGAACGLNPAQRYQVKEWEAEAASRGHADVQYVEYLDPDTALELGFLPFGVGGFYVHRPGLAISGFLWPISIVWLPAMARSSAEEFNYQQMQSKMAILRHQQNPASP